jgi:serine/threonine protein kinase
MGSDRWDDLNRVWHQVLARPEPERPAAIEELCAGDPALREDVQSLLAHLARASAAGFGAAAIGITRARPSLIGRQFGPYSVHALLGAGGMGEVFQARDSILQREVALKILPDVRLPDPERQARFNREARVLASLNHPNIGSIYGVQDCDGVRALVLELVEGETLAARLARHAGITPTRRGLPIADVTALAAQIVDALETAHERGIVHRDLKPANIKITPEGRLKVLDFGLALAMSHAGSDVTVSASTTTITGATQYGTLLGTPAYMSPEQARAQPVDTRTDIWSFGCVLYEMLTGAQAFGGTSMGDVLANVIKGEPDWSLLPVDTPGSLRLCLRRCLERDPAKRLHHVSDVRLALEVASNPAQASGDRTPQTKSVATRVALAGWAVAALVVTAATVTIVMLLRSLPSAPESTVNAPATPPVLVRPKIGGGGEAMTKTIQEAIDLGVRGATVSVLPGTYAERLTIKRGLTLEASGGRSGAVIVAPPGAPESVIEIATTDPVTIRGITVHATGKHAIRAMGAVDLTVQASTILAVNPPLGLNQLLLVSNDIGKTGARARAAIRRNVIDGAVARLPTGVQRPQSSAVQLVGDLDAVVEGNMVRRFGAICIVVDTRPDFGGHTNVEILNNDIDECRPAARVAAIKVGSPPVGVLSPKEPITATGNVNIIGNTIRNTAEDCVNNAIAYDVFTGRIERNRIIDFVKPCASQTPRNMPGAIWLGLRLTGLSKPAVTPTVRFNDIQGNAHAGLRVAPDQTMAADVSCNYWGSAQGPSGIGRGSGDAIVVEPGAPAPVFMPFAAAPIAQTTKTTC